jgi:hypothetical protein
MELIKVCNICRNPLDIKGALSIDGDTVSTYRKPHN